MSLLKDATNEVSLNNACSGQSDSSSKLKHATDDAASHMEIPLTQNLIVELVKNDTSRVELHVIITIPSTAACITSLRTFAKQKSIDTD